MPQLFEVAQRERRTCHSPVCPEGKLWIHCPEPAHWEERQHYGAKGTPSTRVPMTTAHLLQTVAYNLGHAITHNDAAMDKSGGPKDTQFNLEHTQHHLEEAQDHLLRLMDHVREHYPKEAAELDTVEHAEGVQPAPDGDGGG